MAVPPCELRCFERKHMYQTYVARITGASDAVLAVQGQCRVFDARALASATVVLPDGPFAGSYLVQTLEKECEDNAFASRMRVEIEKLPGSPRVEWVRPLTRRLQRLFGWGDVASTRADVVRAAKAGDAKTLMALLPQAASMIKNGEWEWNQLPALHDALRAAPVVALEDCRREVADDEVQLRAMHEALGQHAWSEHPNRKAICSRCEKDAPHVCACGAMRCKQCMLPPTDSAFRPSCSWNQHPTRPLPFYVIDHVKWPDEEKLAWMRQEVGDEADLQTFAGKWLDMFGDRAHGAASQKAACIRLFGQHAPEGAEARAWKKECDISPQERQAFQRLWGDNRELCHECGRATLPGQKHLVRRLGCAFCSTQCATAGTLLSCRECHQPVSAEQLHCATCKWGCHQNILLPCAAASREAGWSI